MKYTMQLHEVSRDTVKSIPRKYISAQHHEANRRVVYSYSKRAVFDGAKEPHEVWTTEQQNIRGVVIDDKRQVLSRGLPKFFNYGEKLGVWNDSAEQTILLEKYNGHCSHLFYDHEIGEWTFHTKASFNEDFQRIGQDLMERGLLFGFDDDETSYDTLDKDYTYICEGIHEDDKHTIPTPEGLYLLVRIHRESQVLTIDTEKYPGEVHFVHSLEGAETLQNSAEHEGYVAYQVTGGQITNILKFKTDYYWTLRELTKEGPQFKLYKHIECKVVDGQVRFAPDNIITIMGDDYDDWYAKHSDTIIKVTALLQHEVDDMSAIIAKYDSAKDVALNAIETGLDTAMCMSLFHNHESMINDIVTKKAKKVLKNVS